LSVAATLQNAGRFVSDGFACAAVEPGAVNVPAETVWASVIVVFGNERAVRLSHVAAFTDVAASVIPANRTANLMIFTFMVFSRRGILTGVARLTALSGIRLAYGRNFMPGTQRFLLPPSPCHRR
jgi:hypothetical protein